MKPKYLLFLTTAAWAAVCFFRIHAVLDPTGGDGYFYLKQADWLAQNFEFYHADYSFIFLPLAILTKLSGSALFSFQLVTTFSLWAITLSIGLIFFDCAGWIKNHWVRIGTACTLSLFMGIQSSVLKLAYEFAKNGLAAGFLMLGIYCYLRQRHKAFVAYFILAALTHKVAALFVLLWLFVLGIQKLGSKKKILGLGVACVLAVGVGIVVFPRLAKHALNFAEHFKFEKYFFMRSENHLMSRVVIVMTFFWILIALTQIKKLRRDLLLPLVLFSAIPFLPIFAGYNVEIKYRLFLLSFVFGAALLALSLHTMVHRFLKQIIVVMSLSGLAFQATKVNGFPWIIEWSRLVQNVDQLDRIVQPGDEVVTQHSLQFYIDYKTKIRARSMISSQRKPKYQIAFTPEFYHLNNEVSDEIKQIEVLSLGPSYGLFEYDDFQNLIREYPMLSDWRNQFQVRPDFVQDY